MQIPAALALLSIAILPLAAKEPPAGLENPAHHLQARFDGAGLQVTHRGYQFRVSPAGLAAPEEIRKRANRVDIDRGNVTEWYVNLPEGLEQGFTFAQKDGPLELRLAISGDCLPSEDSRGIRLQCGDGVSLQYGGLDSWDSNGVRLPGRLEVAGHELRLIVDDRAAQYPVTVDPLIEEAPVRASDGQIGDDFGRAIAANGNTLVVGAPQRNSRGGGVYVYLRSATGWSAETIVLPTPATVGEFGASVSISGDLMVVGAPGESNDAGAVYVFLRRGPGEWLQRARLTPSDPRPGARFGHAVSIDGTNILIGAPGLFFNGQGTGVYLFGPAQGGGFAQVEKRESDGNAGLVVTMKGNRMGYIFRPRSTNLVYSVLSLDVLVGTTWVKTQFGTTAASSRLGLAINGDIAITRVPGSNIVFLLTYSPQNGWETGESMQQPDGISGDFGVSIAFDGKFVVVGAPTASGGVGAAYLFEKTANGWTTGTRLNLATPPSSPIGLGTSTAISSDALLAGAPGGNSGKGEVYSFALRNVSIQSTPSGQSFQLFGPGCGLQSNVYQTPYSGFWSDCTLQWVTNPNTAPGTRSTFQNWADGGNLNPRPFSLTNSPASPAATYTGSFLTEHQLSIQTVPSSGGTVSGAGWYTAGTSAAVAAIANPGFFFSGFSGDLTGTTTPATVRMDGPRTVTGSFASSPSAAISALVTAKTGAVNSRQWTITLTNNGPGIATSPQLFLLMFQQTFGTPCTALPVRLAPAQMPLLLVPSLAPGSSTPITVSLDFSGCPATARFTLSVGTAASGGGSGGTTQLFNQLP